MRITVGICTWNRSHLLDQTLRALAELRIPDGAEWEVLVVNNGSTDETADVLHRHARKLPLRTVWEPQLGKSHALNTGLQNIHSDLILWTDDDVLVDSNCLAAYADAAEQHPDVAYFGGTIEPWFERTPPAWIHAAWPLVDHVFATRQPDPESTWVEPNWLPFGANFAIRTAIQKQFPYDIRLGRVAANEVRGEETDLFQRLHREGFRGRWCPAARVRHFIPAKRMSTQFQRDFYFGMGQTHCLNGEARHSDGSAWSQARLWCKAAFAETRYQLTRRISPPRRWIKDLHKSSYYWGQHASAQTATRPLPSVATAAISD